MRIKHLLFDADSFDLGNYEILKYLIYKGKSPTTCREEDSLPEMPCALSRVILKSKSACQRLKKF